MKIKLSQLRKIIKEETTRLMFESTFNVGDYVKSTRVDAWGKTMTSVGKVAPPREGDDADSVRVAWSSTLGNSSGVLMPASVLAPATEEEYKESLSAFNSAMSHKYATDKWSGD